ncbi:hypothetical protein BDV93DRAFT_521209 [Ceratobasidium sp. AG-I]|nr:hypothetical protein BDV93DRAFT_521209 [Ceratobasidium sp. AG-I]
MSSHRESVFLVGTVAVLAALLPLFFSYAGQDAPSFDPLTQSPNPDPNLSAPLVSTQPKQIPIRALVPYLLAVPRAIISIPSKPLKLAGSSLLLIAAPALVVLDALLALIRLPFRALSAVLYTLYPIYVLCGAAIITGAVLGGLVVGFIKFVLLVQEVRENRSAIDEHTEWRKQKHYSRSSEDY